MSFDKVKDHDELIRDKHSKAVLTVDRRAYFKHLQEKKIAQESIDNRERITRVENDINIVKDEISEIKQMLLQIVSQKVD